MPRIEEHIAPAYIGIDPGTNGGVALIYEGGVPDVQATAIPPTMRDLLRLLETILQLIGTPSQHRVFCVVEKVWARPEQSAPAMWKFGVHYGSVLMALTALQIPFTERTPQEWMKVLRVGTKRNGETQAKWKGRLRERAQQEFPNLPIWQEKRAVVKQNRISDALLIARYCQKQFPIRR
jgi:hypothetical protein